MLCTQYDTSKEPPLKQLQHFACKAANTQAIGQSMRDWQKTLTRGPLLPCLCASWPDSAAESYMCKPGGLPSAFARPYKHKSSLSAFLCC